MRRYLMIVQLWAIIVAPRVPIRNNYLDVFDYVRPEDEVTFHIFSRGISEQSDELFLDVPDSIRNSKFNRSLPTKFIIHGWTHSKDVPWVAEMRDVMAATGLWNIIIVDWSPLSHTIYTEARVHTTVVGNQLSRLCIFLARVANVEMSSLHMIGHSMGAQIAAAAGYQIQQNTGQYIGRISGLDPAAPLYEWPHIESMQELLDPSDAEFVDVIHTNGKHLGIMFPSGHVDYYPNGGVKQPDCTFWVCSHIRSCEYWTASVKNPFLFKAYSFASWNDYLRKNYMNLHAVPMGIAASKAIEPGSYFLETHNEEREYLRSHTTIFDSFINIEN